MMDKMQHLITADSMKSTCLINTRVEGIGRRRKGVLYVEHTMTMQ